MNTTTAHERIAELEVALAHARQVAEAERRRAELAQESARHAWQRAAWARPRDRENASA